MFYFLVALWILALQVLPIEELFKYRIAKCGVHENG
jgi:hypothetical protein